MRSFLAIEMRSGSFSDFFGSDIHTWSKNEDCRVVRIRARYLEENHIFSESLHPDTAAAI